MEKTLRYLENDRVHDPTIPRRVAESSEFGIRVHPHVINDRFVYSERTTREKCDIALFTILYYTSFQLHAYYSSEFIYNTYADA